MCEKSGIRHLATSLPCEVSQKSVPALSSIVVEG